MPASSPSREMSPGAVTYFQEAEVLKGPIEACMDAQLGSVFMPHGLGHLLGVDTHDVGGFTKGFPRSEEPGLKYLRTTRVLEKDMVITVEPGTPRYTGMCSRLAWVFLPWRVSN